MGLPFHHVLWWWWSPGLILPCAYSRCAGRCTFCQMLPRQKLKLEKRIMTNGEEQRERPKFGPRPKFNSKNFDFKQELARLPFPVNIREVELSPSQQKRFLELVYNHQSDFLTMRWGFRSLWLPQAYYSDWRLRNPFTCHTIQFQFSCKLKCANVWILGSYKELYLSITQPIHIASGDQFVRSLERYACVSTSKLWMP